MDEPLYVRIRGRVQGPFDANKLRFLVRRGQLGRMHELSKDGSNWLSASEFPDLFAANDRAEPEEDNVTEATESGTQPPNATAWYYSRGDSQHGPIGLSELKDLIRSARLDAEDCVWRDGMPAWATVDSVPELASVLSNSGHHAPGEGNSSRQRTDVNGETIRILRESRPWVLFIAISGYLFAAAILALGIFSIVQSRTSGGVSLVASGLMCFLYVAVLATGSVYLSSFCGNVQHLVKLRTPRELNAALRTLRSFWIFVSIILIVVMVNCLVGVIWVFSVLASPLPFN